MKSAGNIRLLVFSMSIIFLASVFPSADARGAQPEEKIQQVKKAETPQYREGELLVKFKPGVRESARDRLHRGVLSRKIRSFTNLGIDHVRLPKGMTPAEAVARYDSDPNVEYSEPNYQVSMTGLPNDLLFSQLWGLYNTGQTGGTPGADIDALNAWNITTGNDDVVIAVIDTGVDYTHPDLAPNIWTNPLEIPGNGIDDDRDGYVDDTHGINAITDTGDPFDDCGHGTHVAGTIGAVGNNTIGVAGVNWHVKIMTCKFLDANGSGYIDGALQCMEYVRAMKAKGVNIIATSNSWGGGGYSQALHDAINAQQDILFIAAAGNSAADNDKTDFYPANYFLPNVIAVAATDSNDNKASFSNYGRLSVSVSAPGVNIVSTLPAANLWHITGGYGSLSGTSMATPHVSGLAALVKSQNTTRDWKAIRNLILAGGDDIQSMAGRTITGKRINAFGSLTCVDSPVLSAIEYSCPFQAGIQTAVSALSIDCAYPAGPVILTTSGGETFEMHDDGFGPDMTAGDGIFSAFWTPPAGTSYVVVSSPAGTETLTCGESDYAPLAAGACNGSTFRGTVNGSWVASFTDASADTDSTGIERVIVKWGDGLISSGVQGQTFSHTYFSKPPTSYTITHTAYDTGGQTGTEQCYLPASAFPPPQTWTITATVTTSAATGSKPIYTAMVKVQNTTTYTTTTGYTNTSGVYSARNLKPGTYKITVTKPGYTFPTTVTTVGPSQNLIIRAN